MDRKYFLLLFSLLLSGLGCDTAQKSAPPTRPNIIYILADDLGYGDIGYFGQTNFTTPHLDQLARDGMIFTQHYSGSTVCAPSRSALMTGLHTGHTFVRGNVGVEPEGQVALPDSVVTLAEMIKSAGYVTGAFGKWGLGSPGSEGDPVNQGFDRFFGYNCQTLAHHYFPYRLWNNTDTVWIKANQGNNKKIYAPDLIQQQLLGFLRENQDTSFFAFVPFTLPHAELAAPEQFMKKYRGAFGEETAYQGYDEGPRYRKGPYESQAEPHAAFAAMVYYLDTQIGEIRKTLKELGLEENTLIVFTSDNGPHVEGGADPDFFDSNGPFRGYKRDLYEGGIRVPMIACWPGTVPARDTSAHLSAFWDVVPTLAELTGTELNQEVDGISFLPALLGKEQREQHDWLYWEFYEQDGKRALRQGDWKLVQRGMNQPEPFAPELYNLAEDPGETTDLATQYPDRVEQMMQLMKQAHRPSPVFAWDGPEA